MHGSFSFARTSSFGISCPDFDRVYERPFLTVFMLCNRSFAWVRVVIVGPCLILKWFLKTLPSFSSFVRSEFFPLLCLSSRSFSQVAFPVSSSRICGSIDKSGFWLSLLQNSSFVLIFAARSVVENCSSSLLDIFGEAVCSWIIGLQTVRPFFTIFNSIYLFLKELLTLWYVGGVHRWARSWYAWLLHLNHDRPVHWLEILEKQMLLIIFILLYHLWILLYFCQCEIVLLHLLDHLLFL